MILFEHVPHYVDRSIIVDPYDPVYSLVLIVAGLILCLACLGLIYYSEVKHMNDKFLGKWFVRAANAAVFVALVSLLFAYYPAMEYWYYNMIGGPITYTGLVHVVGGPITYTGLVNRQLYGNIHIASVFLTLLVVLSAILSPVITALFVKASEWIVTKAAAATEPGVTTS